VATARSFRPRGPAPARTAPGPGPARFYKTPCTTLGTCAPLSPWHLAALATISSGARLTRHRPQGAPYIGRGYRFDGADALPGGGGGGYGTVGQDGQCEVPTSPNASHHHDAWCSCRQCTACNYSTCNHLRTPSDAPRCIGLRHL
jgi:hypothetical protein